MPVRANLGECCQLGVSVRDDRIVLREQNTGSNGTGLAVTAINGSPVAALLNLVADDDPANPNAGNYDGVIRTDLLGVPATLVEVASNWNAVNAHAGPDIEITLRDGTIVPVTFDGLNQTGSVEAALNRIRTAAGAAGKLEVTFENKRIRLRDLTAGGGPLQVKAKGGSSVGETLGLLGSDTDGDGVLLGGVLNDVTASTPLGRLVPTWDTVNVHAGPDIRVTLRDGATQFVVRFDGLSASHTLGDLLDRIRDAAPRTASDLDLGSIRLTVPGGQVFSDSPLLVDMTHPMILAFSPGGYLAGLEMIESWLAELQTTALFQTPLPLTGGSKLSDFVKFDEVFHATVVQPIEELIDANRFRTFGDLTLVNGPLTVTCVRVDLPNKQLLFDIQTDLWPAPVTAALGLAGGFGSLSGLSTASTVTVESQVQGEFTLGFDLNAVGSPGGQSFSPAAGTLLSSLNGGAGVEGVTKNPPTGSASDVKVALSDGTTFQAAFSGLTTLGQVIAALNTAADGVGAAGKFQAKISDTPLEAGIELIDKSGGLDGTFKVTALNRSFTENGKTVTKLSRAGLPGVGLGILGSVSEPDENGQRILRGAALHGDSVANHVYLLSSGDDRPEFHATVNLTASDIDATGQLGPAQVQIENGIGSGRLALDFQLRDPNTVPGTQGKITVTELVKSLNSLAQPHDPNTSLLDVDRLDGKAVLTLPATAKLVPATPGGAVLQDGGTINVAWDPVFKKVETGTSPSSNLKQVKFVPATENAKVTVTGFDKLKKLQNLSPSTIADALALVGQYLDSLLGNGNNLLGKKIPGLEENMADLIDVDTALANAAKILKSKAVSTLGTLEEVLETEIEKAVGLPVTNGQDSSVVEISLDEIDGTALKIELHLPVDLAAKSSLDADPAKTGLQLPLSLNLLGKGLGSGSPLSDSDGAALMDVTAGAVFHVGLGLDLSNPTAPRPFLYGGNDPGDTRATVSVRAQAGGLNFNASVGPLGLFVKNGSFVLDQDGDGAGTGPATFTAGLSEGRHYLSNPGGLALQTNVSLVGGVHGALPVFFPTEAAKHRLSPDVGVEVDNLAAFLVSPTDNVFTVPDLQQAVNNMNFADGMSGFAAGWDGVFQVLETVVDNQVFVTKIPLIGDQLVDASRFLLDLRRRVSDNLQQAGGKTLVFVQQKLYEALGEGGLNWLQDRNGDGAITKADVGVLADGIDITNTLLGENPQPPVDLSTRTIVFDVSLQQPLADLAIPVGVDLAIPGLDLDVDGRVKVQAGARFDLRIGVDRNDGVFLDTSRPDELGLTVVATLPGLRARAELGFLQLDVADSQASPSRLAGGYLVDLKDPNGDGRLTLGELKASLRKPDRLIDARFDMLGNTEAERRANSRINLDFVTSFEGNANFPELSGRFEIGFNPDSRDGSSLFDFRPEVTIADVRFNPGQVIRQFAGPLLDKVADVLAPMKPVTDFVTDPLPLISELSGSPVTMLDLGEMFGYVDPQTRQWIEAADMIVDLAADYQNVGDGSISVGTFRLDAVDLRHQSASQLSLDGRPVFVNGDELADAVIASAADLAVNEISSQLTGSAGGFVSRTRNVPAAEDGRGLQFPLLDNPLAAFQLLLGQDVDLFTYDMPRFGANFEYTSTPFPVFPPYLFGYVVGRLGVSADFDFGYDTRGIRQYLQSGQAATLINGFFVDDHLGGSDAPEVTLTGSLSVVVGPPKIPKINIGGASIKADAGVEGGLFAEIGLDLNDPNHDGKMNFDELAAVFQHDVRALFDAKGEIALKLQGFVFIEAEFKVLGKKKSKTIVDIRKDIIPPIVLYEFEYHADPIPPVEPTPEPPEPVILAAVGSGQGGVPTLSLTDGLDVSDNDTIVISRPGGTGDYQVSITSRDGDGNVTQSLTTVLAGSASAQAIEIDAGPGNDAVTIDATVTIPTRLYGGLDDDVLTGGSAADVIYGGEGRDTIYGGGGNDQLYGEGGNDEIHGGEGNDYIDGGLGNDALDISGRGGLYGDDGDDTIIGGGGSDDLFGGPDNDTLIAAASTRGEDRDAIHTLAGGEGNNTIYGDLGVDTITSGSGNDVIYAYDGSDSINAGSGDDRIVAGLGSDTIIGGLGKDVIYAGNSATGGGSANDVNTIYGDDESTEPNSGGADVIYGDLGQDIVYAAGGHNRVFAFAGNDEIHAGGGNDQIDAGAGDDFVGAGAGNDQIVAGAGSDTIIGGWGQDTIYAGASGSGGGSAGDFNVIYGGVDGFFNGRDITAWSALPAGPAVADHEDTIYGDAGLDIIYAGAGSDRITSLGGSDIVHAGEGIT